MRAGGWENEGSVGAYEAKVHLGELLERVSHGEEITITRYGLPIARLVPAKAGLSQVDRRAAIDQLLKMREGLSLNGLKIKDLIDEGRR